MQSVTNTIEGLILKAFDISHLVATVSDTGTGMTPEGMNRITYAALMDMIMPTMEGLTAIPLLKRSNPDLKAFATSGLGSTDAAAKADQLGFQGFLPKPFTTRELLELLRSSR